MYLLIAGIWVNTAHIVSIEPPDDAGSKSILVALSNGDRLRVPGKAAKTVYDAVVENTKPITQFAEFAEQVCPDAAPFLTEKPARKRK